MITCPSHRVKIGKRWYELRMDFNALALVERVTGKNLLDSKLWNDMDVSTLTAVFWACAVQTDEKLTITEVRSASFKDATKMTDATREAFKLANEVTEEDDRPMSGSEPVKQERRA